MTRNGLPEHINYRDDGCDIHPRCLTCPLPACRYDLPQGRAHAIARTQALAQLLAAGRTPEEAAALLGVSRSTVYRRRRR